MLRRALWISLAILIPSFSSQVFAANRTNIVMVTLESARVSRMNFLGARGQLTPHLDSFSRDGLIFEHAFAQAPSTVVSHATLLTGAYPQVHHASELGFLLAPTLPFLPDLLHTRGYKTGAFVGSAELDPFSGLAPGFDRGFDSYDTGAPASQTGPLAPARRGTEVVAHAAQWLTAHARDPFFVWIELADAAASGNPYDRSLAAMDAGFGRLVATLRALKLYDDAVIVLAGDHGESLGSHGEDGHGIFLYDETTHVPLMVKLPRGQMAGKRISGRVRLVDLAPTLLEAAGIPVPSQMQGQSLLRVVKTNPAADQPAYARSDFPQQAFGWSSLESWRAGKYLYIRAPKPELYDLSADPAAVHNLAQTSKATLDTMAAQLQAFDQHLGGEGAKATGLTSSEARKLASLGYVGLEKSNSGVNPAATGTDPKDTIAVANQTLAAMRELREGKLDAALAGLERVTATQPNIFLGQFGLGVALAHRQDYKRAIEHLHRAIEFQPNAPWAHYEMAACLMKTGDFKAAATHLELAVARLPRFRDAHLLLAEAYERLGRSGEAAAEKSKGQTPAQ